MKTGVSVVIPCYNSSDRLPETISHLARQVVPKNIPWEIIVVDNASTDNTTAIAQNIWESFKSNVPFKVVKQHIQGLSAAREKGFEESQFEYVLFCDDDNWLDERYVRLAFEIMSSNSDIGVAGGWGVPVADVKFPEWFQRLPGGYGIGAQGDESGDISNKKGYVYGAGCIIRRSAWNFIKSKGFKFILSDRKGEGLSGGGDEEICYRMRLAGYKIWYNSELHFKHYIPEKRLSWRYYLKLKEYTHRSFPILKAYEYVLSHNDSSYKRPSNKYWMKKCIILLVAFRYHIKTFIRSYFDELVGNDNLRRYYIRKGQLFGWLKLRGQFCDICDTLNVFKYNCLNNPRVSSNNYKEQFLIESENRSNE